MTVLQFEARDAHDKLVAVVVGNLFLCSRDPQTGMYELYWFKLAAAKRFERHCMSKLGNNVPPRDAQGVELPGVKLSSYAYA